MINELISPLLLVLATAPGPATKVSVLTTLPDFRDIAVQIGGDRVDATSLLKGPEDPHFVDAKPSFIRAANQADLFILNGMELEIGYEPMIVAESRNPKIQPGTPGHCDVSISVHKLEVPTAIIDRTRGDVHAAGNPHYMLDPVNGKLVAQTIRDHLKQVDPSAADAYDRGYEAFARKVDEAMFGPKILARFRPQDLEELLAQGTLLEFLKKRGADQDLVGWAGALAPFAGSRIVDYHAGGSRYLADRFHLEVLSALEDKPGIAPSLSHLGEVVQIMKARGVKALLYSPYNKQSNVDWVASQTGVAAAMLAHSVDALPGTHDYISMLNRNVDAVRRVLSKP